MMARPIRAVTSKELRQIDWLLRHTNLAILDICKRVDVPYLALQRKLGTEKKRQGRCLVDVAEDANDAAKIDAAMAAIDAEEQQLAATP